MAATTDEAANHEPTGDPDHVAYGKDYWWSCECGSASPRLTRQAAAEAAAEEHEQWCFKGGEATVRVNV